MGLGEENRLGLEGEVDGKYFTNDEPILNINYFFSKTMLQI